MGSGTVRIDPRRFAATLVVGAAVAWGLRLTLLEGFVYAWPRHFDGDFAAAMFDPRWWDGTGIMYGPVFVAERWLVNAWPRFFTIEFFALANIPLIAIAFALTAAAARGDRFTLAIALAAWLCFRGLYIAFSVSANPEILELTLLSAAWYATSRNTHSGAWVAASLATLTKVIPGIFAPVLLLRASRKAVAAGVVTGLALMAAAGAGQHLGLQAVIRATSCRARTKVEPRRRRSSTSSRCRRRTQCSA